MCSSDLGDIGALVLTGMQLRCERTLFPVQGHSLVLYAVQVGSEMGDLYRSGDRPGDEGTPECRRGGTNDPSVRSSFGTASGVADVGAGSRSRSGELGRGPLPRRGAIGFQRGQGIGRSYSSPVARS